MYLGDLYVDKTAVDFEDMDTAKEKQRHLEALADVMVEENKFEIMSSGIQPKFYIHYSSVMNRDLRPQSWKEIIEAIGSIAAKKDIEKLSKELSHKNETTEESE